LIKELWIIFSINYGRQSLKIVNLNAILKIEYYLSIIIEATNLLYFTNNYLTVDLKI